MPGNEAGNTIWERLQLLLQTASGHRNVMSHVESGKFHEDLASFSLLQLAFLIRTKRVSPVEILEALLGRIQEWDSVLASYITVCADQALVQARKAESRILRGGYLGPLDGLPIAHKDIIWTEGIRTTGHSRTLYDFRPTRNATVVQRLEDAGMILIGKTNTIEFARGSMHLFGETPNPWNLDHFTGGSSAGSASAVAAGLAVAATGTDTGGSIRNPASFCGIVGLKPTYGRVSRDGVLPLSWSTDHVGPMARTVADAACLLEVMAGFDERDPSSSRLPVDSYLTAADQDLGSLRIGLPGRFFFENLDPEVDRCIRAALNDLKGLDVEFEDINLDHAGDLESIRMVISTVESYGHHANRMRERARDYGELTRQRIAAGAFFTAAQYVEAMRVRGVWVREMARAFRRVDVIVTPTMRMPAISMEDWRAGIPHDTAWGTLQANLSGHPAITVPCGFTDRNLPVGLQFTARPFEEGTLVRIAHAYEQMTEWHKRRPALESYGARRTLRLQESSAGHSYDASYTGTGGVGTREKRQDTTVAKGTNHYMLRAQAAQEGLDLDEADFDAIAAIVSSTTSQLESIRAIGYGDVDHCYRFDPFAAIASMKEVGDAAI